MISKTNKIRLVKLTYLYVNSYILLVIFLIIMQSLIRINIRSSALIFEFDRFVLLKGLFKYLKKLIY